MKLVTKVTLFFLGSMLCVNLLVLIGLPFFFSNLITGQMESHARTYVAFIKKEIEDLPSHNPRAFSASSRPEFERAIVSEFRSAMAVGEDTGGFVVDSIRLLDSDGRVLAGFPLVDMAGGQVAGAELKAAMKSGAISIYDEAGKRDSRSGSTINIVARAEPFPDTVYAVDVRMDFDKSMQMHRSEYVLDEFLVIAAAVLVELLQALVLLRLLGRAALRPVAKISIAMASVALGKLDTRIDHGAKDEFGVMATRFNDMVKSLNEKEHLSRYVSRSTMQMVQGSSLRGTAFREPVRKHRVIFFSDIRGFTGYSESLEPEVVIRTLNRILDIQSAAINACGGAIDKYIGDEIMAVFESPRSALICALKIQRLLGDTEEYAKLRVGIGICEGMVVEGDVGVDAHKDFTLIGDAVNTAARLQAMAGPGVILVPADMMAGPDMAVFEYSMEGLLHIRGKREKMSVAKVLGIRQAARRGAAGPTMSGPR